MFKNMVKRARLSISRKPMRAIIIGLVLFAMANLVLASTAIKSAVAESMAYAKSSLGGTVYLQADMSKLREQAQSGQTPSSSSSGRPPQIERPDIPVSLVTGIAESEYVKDYTYSLSAQAKANGFSVVESEESGNFGGSRQPGANFGSESTETQLDADVTVQGINSYAFISAVQDETMKLTSGTYFDESTDDQAIISYDLAEANGLAVGDTITLQNIYDSGMHEIKIIGIYDLSEEQGFGTSANTIYMNVPTAAKLLSSENYNDGAYSVQNVSFTLTNAEYSDQFIAQTKEKYPDLESDNLTLSIDTSAYEQMVGPIESVGAFATTIFWVVIIASIAIIALIVTINVKERRYEIGVLLSLGASKLNVAGQIVLELVVVGTAAFLLSIGTGTIVAKAVGQNLLNNQLSMSEQQSENNFGRPTGGRSGGSRNAPGGGMMGGSASRTRSDVETIDSIDVNATPADYALLFLVGYGVIIAALIIPTWNIVKYQPKTILTGKE